MSTSHELPTHPTLRHPLTGAPLRALGVTKYGHLIWPVLGASQPNGEPAGQPHIPGLITPSGTAQPPLPATAQPGGGLPAGTVTSGLLPTAMPATVVPLPTAAQPTAVPTVPQVTAQPVAPVQPASMPPAQPMPVLPTTVPGLAQPAAQPITAPVPQAGAEIGNGLDDGDGKEYPEGKPLAEMTDSEKAAYYKWYSRQWENRAKGRGDYDALKTKASQYDQLVASQATETEKQIAAARVAGYQEATAKAAIVLVDAHVRAGLQTRLQPHQVEALAANLNHQHFLAPDGLTVDAAKVSTFVDTVAPAQATPAVSAVTAPAVPAAPGALPTGVPMPGQLAAPATGLPRNLPDLGQGSQSASPLDKLELGRQQAKQFLASSY